MDGVSKREEFRDLHTPPCIVWIVTARRLQRTVYVATTGEIRNIHTVILARKPLGKVHLEDRE
jgi:hypothetical protein